MDPLLPIVLSLLRKFLSVCVCVRVRVRVYVRMRVCVLVRICSLFFHLCFHLRRPILTITILKKFALQKKVNCAT